MTEVLTAVDAYIKSVCAQAIADAMPQIKASLKELIVQYVSNCQEDVILEAVTEEVHRRMGEYDMDDVVRTFIRDHVSVSIDC